MPQVTVPQGSVAGTRLTGTWQGLAFSVLIPDGVIPGQRFVAELPQTEEQEDQDTSLNPHFKPKGQPPLGLKPIPERTSSVFNRAFFMWITPLLCLSGKKAIEKSDMWTIPEYNKADRVTDAVYDLYLESKVRFFALRQLVARLLAYPDHLYLRQLFHPAERQATQPALCSWMHPPG